MSFSSEEEEGGGGGGKEREGGVVVVDVCGTSLPLCRGRVTALQRTMWTLLKRRGSAHLPPPPPAPLALPLNVLHQPRRLLSPAETPSSMRISIEFKTPRPVSLPPLFSLKHPI